MKKIFLVLAFTPLFTLNIFGQAAVDIPILATDGTAIFDLAVGLDLTATNCIDPQLGEWDIPPIPPNNNFFICFDLNPYGCPQANSYKDYRPPGNPPAFPFTGTIEHTLWFQTSTSGLSIDITYNLPYGTLMTITDQIGGSFLSLGPFTGQGTATIPGSYTSIFSKAFLIIEYENIIPVELTSFTASVLHNEKAVQLNWTTSTETNNSGFEILRFTQNDNNDWNKIGFVPGHGTTTEPKSYSFIDEDVSSGNYKYRLKQIDFDGTFTYSKEIEVEIDFTPKEFVLEQNYPNPFNPTTKIRYQVPELSFIALKIYDVLGNEIETLINYEKPAGNYDVKFDATGLPSGIYFYQLKAGNFISIKKMVLLK